jgi:diguanylate cyclase
MNFNAHDLLNARKWNRKLMNFLWFFVIPSYILMESLSLLTKGVHHLLEWAIPYLVAPTGTLMIVLGLMELIPKYAAKARDYCTLTAVIFCVFIFIWIHSDVTSLMIMLVFPIWISVFYFEKRKVFYATLLTYAFFLGTIWLQPKLAEFLADPNELMATISLFVISPFLSLSIMSRGRDISLRLRKATEAQQELMVRNIMMDRLSKIDALTDLYNHITFHEYLDRMLEQLDGSSVRIPIHLAVADIDNFKKINDTYGHRAGDAVLRSVANVIRSTLKADDIAARYGGEEFAMILTNKTVEEAWDILEQFREEIAKTTHPELVNETVTISIGLKEYEWGEGKEALFQAADEALYKAKRTGKNRTVLAKEQEVQEEQLITTTNES